MSNPLEKFKVAILHLNRDWNDCPLFQSSIFRLLKARELSGSFGYLIEVFHFMIGSFLDLFGDPVQTCTMHSKKLILNLGDILCCSNVQTNYLLASK